MIATAPGKLILTGEYAVLDGAPALVIAVDRRVSARRHSGPRGSSPFLIALADELAARFGPESPAARAALEIVCDSRALFIPVPPAEPGALHLGGPTKLGLGSSAAVTVAATALALSADHTRVPVIDRELVADIAYAVHARAQHGKGARGSGADIAAAVHGGAIAFSQKTITRLTWPAGVTVLPFFTGASADTPTLVAKVAAAREANPAAVNAALTSIAETSRAACLACQARPEIAADALLAALRLAATAMDRLALATGLPLVPNCVSEARARLAQLGGTAKTTGAGGGDVAVAVIPATEDVTNARRYLIEAGCEPLRLSLDYTGVDLQPDAA